MTQKEIEDCRFKLFCTGHAIAKGNWELPVEDDQNTHDRGIVHTAALLAQGLYM